MADFEQKPRYLPPIFGFDRLFPELDRTPPDVARAGFPDGARILISGEAGCGKTTFALAIIRALMRQWNDPGYLQKGKLGVFADPTFSPTSARAAPHQLYYLSTEVDWKRLDRLFGQYGWFARDSSARGNKDAVFKSQWV